MIKEIDLENTFGIFESSSEECNAEYFKGDSNQYLERQFNSFIHSINVDTFDLK